jgi:hypothetical protein
MALRFSPSSMNSSRLDIEVRADGTVVGQPPQISGRFTSELFRLTRPPLQSSTVAIASDGRLIVDGQMTELRYLPDGVLGAAGDSVFVRDDGTVLVNNVANPHCRFDGFRPELRLAATVLVLMAVARVIDADVHLPRRNE